MYLYSKSAAKIRLFVCMSVYISETIESRATKIGANMSYNGPLLYIYKYIARIERTNKWSLTYRRPHSLVTFFLVLYALRQQAPLDEVWSIMNTSVPYTLCIHELNISHFSFLELFIFTLNFLPHPPPVSIRVFHTHKYNLIKKKLKLYPTYCARM